ncbi:hypothetical protein NQZ79_g3279 [Umbelopsis isabellina]|nr:hypothetical protein NQZ79_g3279 [Umbelopsis isabellina]
MMDIERSSIEIMDEDAKKLYSLGYKQEFKREFNALSIFCFAFSIMGVLASVSSTINFPMLSGGPVSMVYGWILGSSMVMCVALSLAELVSAWPASGGLYFFAAKLTQQSSDGRWTPIVTWFTGWFNLIGNMALVASIDYTLSTMVMAEITMATDFEFEATFPQTYGVYIVVPFLHGLMGSLSTRWLARVNQVYVYLNMGSTIVVIVCLFVLSPNKNSAQWVFTHFDADTVGWPAGMAFLLGLIDVMWTLTGYDCSAHLSEECQNASTAAPKAIIQSVASVAITGWVLILAIAFTVPSIDEALATATGMPMAQIFFAPSAGSATVVAASRVIFAFSRDNALPFSRLWKKVSPYTSTPINAVWMLVSCSAVLGCLGFIAISALNAVFNVASIGLYVSYTIPIFCRITIGRNNFVPGPFSLGKWAVPIGTVACLWVAFISIIFLLYVQISHGSISMNISFTNTPLIFLRNSPTTSTVDDLNMNYAVVVIGAIVIGAGLWFAIDARKWFHGPVVNLECRSISTESASVMEKVADSVDQIENVE